MTTGDDAPGDTGSGRTTPGEITPGKISPGRVPAPVFLAAGLCLRAVVASLPAGAQPAAAKAGAAKGKVKPVNPLEIKRLDAKLDEVRESFLRDTTTLISSYENLGQFERAKTLLEALQKLDPRNEPIKAKLGQLNEKILDASEIELEIEAGGKWQPVGGVVKDRPIRIRATGDYQLAITQTAGPDGMPNDSFAEDMAPNVPLGAVMGVIVPPESLAQLAGGRQPERPLRAFTVGETFERAADRDGVLYVRVNVPATAKCTGKIALRVGGADRPAN
jgi:hypothetical protein